MFSLMLITVAVFVPVIHMPDFIDRKTTGNNADFDLTLHGS